ncbi:Glutamyl-tRNA(Gln) amidotransferase subunit A [uncultured delta proteobacterium]|uniref:Glutamyl-tRNA(Gln) amidotransferase subunit A n=1 Tax=uncultured delta proteobacterium TaxID=34034 RepID=A0A212JUJ5_9DELT|nr:Glutamyl-tRNA(Gln) amidotransferase subunit A [uncultured delta proteobacterium]
MSSLYTLSLHAVRGALAKGEVTATEAATACFDRIRATDGVLGAILPWITEESVLEQTKALDAAGPDPAKPLWGVPVALKDNICLKGFVTAAGSRILENFVPFYDAFVVAKLKEAGAVIIAKTNLDEFAMGSTTETSAFKVTVNPWDVTRIPGGSSGGSAASVAAHQVYGALASDTGGSIRQPAGLCGCVGVKPTYGRISRYGVVGYGSSLDQVGALARNVADAALLLQVIAGHDPREATSAQLPVEDYLAAVRCKDNLKGLRIGVPAEFWDGNAPEVDGACRAALAQAEKLGATLVEVSLPNTRYGVAAYYILSPAEASTNLARFDGVRYGLRDKEATELLDMYVGSRSKGFGEEVQRRILLGTFVLSAGYYDAYYKKAAQVRRLILQDYQKAFAQCDLLAAPAAPTTAWAMGENKDDPVAAYRRDALTLSLNLAGLPGMTVPAGLGEDSDLPVGLQLFAPAFKEAMLLGAGAALFEELPPLGMPRGIL